MAIIVFGVLRIHGRYPYWLKVPWTNTERSVIIELYIELYLMINIFLHVYTQE